MKPGDRRMVRIKSSTNPSSWNESSKNTELWEWYFTLGYHWLHLESSIWLFQGESGKRPSYSERVKIIYMEFLPVAQFSVGIKRPTTLTLHWSHFIFHPSPHFPFIPPLRYTINKLHRPTRLWDVGIQKDRGELTLSQREHPSSILTAPDVRIGPRSLDLWGWSSTSYTTVLPLIVCVRWVVLLSTTGNISELCEDMGVFLLCALHVGLLYKTHYPDVLNDWLKASV